MITPRIEKIRQNYVNAKPQISCERAAIWTESYQTTEGQPACIRAAKAFYDCCDRLGVHIFEGELVVGAVGEFRKCGILTPEFSWMWVDREMDSFATRPQDPYVMTEEQRQFVREKIFPYWKGKSLEEAFLARLPAETRRIGVDTGVIDSDSKWRQAVGEITPDYQDVLFQKGFAGILQEAEAHIAALDDACPEDEDKRDFHQSVILACRGIIRLAERYADEAGRLAGAEPDADRAAELRAIAENCRHVPAHPPETFWQAVQFVWFTQLGGILSENPLALNPDRFDQYMDPYYEKDLAEGRITRDEALELLCCLRLKDMELNRTSGKNNRKKNAGMAKWHNYTIGGVKADGTDATNAITYLLLEAAAITRASGSGGR